MTDERRAGAPAAKGRRRILVIDDDADIAASVCDVLDAAGYNVEASGDGEDALARCANGKIDLVLLDWRLPSQPSGAALVRKLVDTCGTIPIVVLSADPGSLAEARAARVTDYLPKPFEVADLIHLVDAYCPL